MDFKLKQKISTLLLTGVMTVSAMPVMAEGMTAQVARLTHNVTNTIAMAAVDECEKMGIPVSVSVVDRNGILQTQIRATMAPPVSLGISQKKAYTAVMFNAKGSQLEGRANSPLVTLGEGLAFMAGSTPIQAGGKLYGAVGVSGAPDGKDDEKCAVAGVQAVLDDLEMM